MAIEIVVPRSGWSMEEGTFAGWLKNEGEKVAIGDRLFALESDKAVEEAESMDAGTLRLPPGAPQKGDRVKVGQLLGYLLADGEALPGGQAAPAAPAATAKAPSATSAASSFPAPIEIVVPRSGWSMEEGTFAGWLKQEGDHVAVGDRLFALESDKAVEEAEAMDAGILRLPPGAPRKGDRVKVGQLLGYLLAEGQPLPSGGDSSAAAAAAAHAPTELGADIGGDAPKGGSRPPGALERPAAHSPSLSSSSTSVPVTPRARRAAKELGVDLSGITGTGRDGRIRERDVRSADAPRVAAAPRSSGITGSAGTGGTTEIATTSLRRTIAARMKRSQAETAPVTLTSRADATNLVALRNQFKTAAKDQADAVVPAFTDIIAKLTALALQRHPLLAGRWEGEKIILPSEMNIGIAVDTEAGLLVPVVTGVQALSLPELARRSRALITAAQNRKIKAENLQGGVFTITNLGNFGIDAFTPIINFPETAILGLGAIRREVVVLPDGHFGSREVITLSLTFDHRVVDGAPAARFVQTLVQGLENPSAWLLGA